MKTLVIHPKDKTTDFLKPIYHGRDWTVITGNCTKEEVAKAIDEHDHIIMMGHGTPQGLLAMNQFNGKRPAKEKYAIKPRTQPTQKPVTAGTGNVGKSLLKEQPKYGSLLPKGYLDDDDWLSDRKVGAYTGGYYSGMGGAYNSTVQSLTTGYVIDDDNAEQLRGKRVTAIWCNADQYMEWNNIPGFYTGMFVSDTSEAQLIGTADHEQWQVDQQNYAFVEVVRKHIDDDAETLHSALMNHYGPLAELNAVAKYNLRRLYYNNQESIPVLEEAQ